MCCKDLMVFQGTVYKFYMGIHGTVSAQNGAVTVDHFGPIRDTISSTVVWGEGES